MIFPSNDDLIWALDETARKNGFTPHAESTVCLLRMMESVGWIECVNEDNKTWVITDSGQQRLTDLKRGVIYG